MIRPFESVSSAFIHRYIPGTYVSGTRYTKSHHFWRKYKDRLDVNMKTKRYLYLSPGCSGMWYIITCIGNNKKQCTQGIYVLIVTVQYSTKSNFNYRVVGRL